MRWQVLECGSTIILLRPVPPHPNPVPKEREKRAVSGCPFCTGPPLFTVLWLISAILSHAAMITEDFAKDPVTHGWRIFGDTNLFVWNASNHSLNVTWDSSRPNSYFHLPLGTILNRYDDFSLALDLQLTDVATGVNSSKPSTFELALGFLNAAQATNANFLRGNSFDSPNLVEFD